MANSNFVVHNGLTVGPLTIDAATGDINTPGNVNISGNVGVSSIQKGDTQIAITDTGTNSTIVYNIDGSLRANMNSSGMNITGALNTTGNIITAKLDAGSINTTGNILGAVGTFSSINIAGEVAASLADATALAIALGG